MSIFQKMRDQENALVNKYQNLSPNIAVIDDIDDLILQFLKSDKWQNYMLSTYTPLCPQPEVSTASFIRFKNAVETNNWSYFNDIDIKQSYGLFAVFSDYLEENIANRQRVAKSSKAKTKPATRKKSIPATLKRLVWNKHIGEEVGKAKCLCCVVTDITQLSFNCGHIVSESEGGETTLDNLLPICQNCNSSMGKMNMQDFKDKHKI